MSQYGWNDCPTEVQQQVERLCNSFRLQLVENLIGIYLHGSLATGCFNLLRSDIDLLVVTQDRIAVETKRGLARFLLDTSLNPSPIEISFLQHGDLHPWRYATPFDFHFSEDWRDKFELELSNDDWKQWNAVQRFDDDLAAHITVLNYRGVCLYGQPISEVFPSVPKQDFVRSILDDVLSPKFGLDAVLQYPVYVVLNSCRTLAFLQAECVMSKDEGGRWALENLPAEFHQIIAGVLEEYHNNRNESNLTKEPLVNFAVYMKNELEQASRSKTAC
jgi:streptomycin 3"-adenylyltransferase